MRGNKGYTIVELLTALTVIGLLMVVGIPAIKSFTTATDVRATATQLMTDSWLARQRAIATSRPHSVLFDPDQNRYRIFRDDGNGVSGNAANGQIDSGEEVLMDRNLEEGFFLSEINLDPDNVVIFVSRGTLRTGTGGGYVVIGSDRGSRTVFIRASGHCRVD